MNFKDELTDVFYSDGEFPMNSNYIEHYHKKVLEKIRDWIYDLQSDLSPTVQHQPKAGKLLEKMLAEVKE